MKQSKSHSNSNSKSSSTHSSSAGSLKSLRPKKETAILGVSVGTAGTVLGAAAVGAAGYFAWKNREAIKSFAGKYLPASLNFGSTGEIGANGGNANGMNPGEDYDHDEDYRSTTYSGSTSSRI